MDHTADWWLGDLTHPWFLELERAINDEWGAEPMRVREGGVRTSLPFLSPRLSAFAELLSTRLVRTVHTVPRKNLPLSRASPPDGPELGALVCSLLIN